MISTKMTAVLTEGVASRRLEKVNTIIIATNKRMSQSPVVAPVDACVKCSKVWSFSSGTGVSFASSIQSTMSSGSYWSENKTQLHLYYNEVGGESQLVIKRWTTWTLGFVLTFSCSVEIK